MKNLSKYGLWTVVMLLGCVFGGGKVCAAEPRAVEILRQVAEQFRTYRSYEVRFVVTAGEHVTRGGYSVEGERYRLVLGDADVYSDGKVRYEVDNRNREVTIVGIDNRSHNMLDNPTHAFDFVGDTYAAELVRESNGRAVVRLTPRKGSGTEGVITLTVGTEDGKPQSVLYDYDGELIHIHIDAISPLSSRVEQYDAARFKGYEMIDFR